MEEYSLAFTKKRGWALEITGRILFLSLLTQFNKSLSPTINYCLMEGCACFLYKSTDFVKLNHIGAISLCFSSAVVGYKSQNQMSG